jgi:hypothetical protein
LEKVVAGLARLVEIGGFKSPIIRGVRGAAGRAERNSNGHDARKEHHEQERADEQKSLGHELPLITKE